MPNSSGNDSGANKRRHIRFRPDTGELAYIDLLADNEFKPEIQALIVNESPMGGCCLVMLRDDETEKLRQNDRCRVKVGKLAPLKAEAVWVRRLDEDVIKVGFRFLE